MNFREIYYKYQAWRGWGTRFLNAALPCGIAALITGG